MKFYLVWNPERTAPRVRHSTKEEAIQEAERLASLTPGANFFVLEAIARSATVTPAVATIGL